MIYELKNDKLSMKVDTLGAELISCTDKSGYEYIHQKSELWAGQAKNLFPSIGQTKDNFIMVEGKKYKAKQHGFAMDMEFSLLEQSENSLLFVLKSNEETKAFFPYDFNFYISFVLKENSIIQSFKVENLKETPMYFAIGSHTGFYAPKGSYLDFGTNSILTEIKRKDMMYLTGQCDRFIVKEGILPLLSDTYNHGADILTGFNQKKISLKNYEDSHSVTVDFTEFSYLGIWAPANSQIAISIMPWCGLPDAENTTHNFEEKQGNVRLEGGKSFEVKQVLTFEA